MERDHILQRQGAGSGLLARHGGFFNEIQRTRVMSNTCVKPAHALTRSLKAKRLGEPGELGYASRFYHLLNNPN